MSILELVRSHLWSPDKGFFENAFGLASYLTLLKPSLFILQSIAEGFGFKISDIGKAIDDYMSVTGDSDPNELAMGAIGLLEAEAEGQTSEASYTYTLSKRAVEFEYFDEKRQAPAATVYHKMDHLRKHVGAGKTAAPDLPFANPDDVYELVPDSDLTPATRKRRLQKEYDRLAGFEKMYYKNLTPAAKEKYLARSAKRRADNKKTKRIKDIKEGNRAKAQRAKLEIDREKTRHKHERDMARATNKTPKTPMGNKTKLVVIIATMITSLFAISKFTGTSSDTNKEQGLRERTELDEGLDSAFDEADEKYEVQSFVNSSLEAILGE